MVDDNTQIGMPTRKVTEKSDVQQLRIDNASGGPKITNVLVFQINVLEKSANRIIVWVCFSPNILCM